ncbi:MAG: metalloregulator ArsR/SmtB family transcription factor [bacterium]|uniref:Metalloregulator ArsR/SmtB family transcription factor n=1 Tax=Candidatus Methylomirabilis tolerans TaxID=3123416 RepID=A0AAJ1EIH4_9BACT|nr:metalloregulator ArsR/SmtB family transcription factor [Candidatus Methylomirabilis sp.]
MPSLISKGVEQAVRRFHALADETRLQIIERLRDGEQCVCDLSGILGTAQSLLSFHLKTLKDAGILRDRREGRWVYYSLNSEAIAELEEFIGSIKPRRGRGSLVVSNRCK